MNDNIEPRIKTGDMLPRHGPDPCPACGSREVLHIGFGYPAPSMLENQKPWERLGGCVRWPGAPTRVCQACGHGWGARVPGGMVEPPLFVEIREHDVLVSLDALMEHAKVTTLLGVGDWISNYTELDAFVDLERGGGLIVGFRNIGIGIEFPLTVDEFWAAVEDLEDQLIEEIEAEDEDEDGE